MPEYSSGLAAHELGHIGIFLLRHDRRAGAEAIWQVDEVELRRSPKNELFGKTREVHHDCAAAARDFDREIAVAHRV